jgi:hypothetical protein
MRKIAIDANTLNAGVDNNVSGDEFGDDALPLRPINNGPAHCRIGPAGIDTDRAHVALLKSI